MIIAMKKNIVITILTIGLMIGGNCYADLPNKTMGILSVWTGMSLIAAATHAGALLGNWSDKVKVARIARYALRTNIIVNLPVISLSTTIEIALKYINEDNPYKDTLCKAAIFPFKYMVQEPAIMLQNLEDKYKILEDTKDNA